MTNRQAFMLVELFLVLIALSFFVADRIGRRKRRKARESARQP